MLNEAASRPMGIVSGLQGRRKASVCAESTARGQETNALRPELMLSGEPAAAPRPRAVQETARVADDLRGAGSSGYAGFVEDHDESSLQPLVIGSQEATSSPTIVMRPELQAGQAPRSFPVRS